MVGRRVAGYCDTAASEWTIRASMMTMAMTHAKMAVDEEAGMVPYLTSPRPLRAPLPQVRPAGCLCLDRRTGFTFCRPSTMSGRRRPGPR